MEPLKFKVAPHIVEDLGLNLYTSLPRVLVEFIANAYDADSPWVQITFDKVGIEVERRSMAKQYELELARSVDTGSPVDPLAARILPEQFKIVIEDAGDGMSREDLNNKFLLTGRRRRQEEPERKGRSQNGRPLMGRKGLGKLAGFGVGKLIEVCTRKRGEDYATRITLDYETIAKNKATHEIIVPEERLPNGGDFTDCGTRITLSRLLYDPLKSKLETIDSEIADHFALIEPEEFSIQLNGNIVKPIARNHAYAWPKPDEVPIQDLVVHTLAEESGASLTFSYRFYFTGKNEALPASQRGVRVYAHKRLAATPSLLGADTNMHGFRMTDYLDGVVHADFIDEQPADYIATDRQTLRWESPLLSGMYDFLSGEIKEACKNYQRKRDDEAPKIVENDPFTQTEIGKYEFIGRDRKMAIRFASILEGAAKRGVDDPVYKTKLPVLVRSIGHGNILAAIAQLAEQENPDLGQVAIEVARLTADELDQFISTVKGRMKAIEALKKIVEAVDFRSGRDEKTIQKMFEKAPWMVDPTYTQFLTTDQSLDSTFRRLAKELKIGDFAGEVVAEDDDERADLVFLLGNESLNRLVIVELKAPNLPLESQHLDQLEYYIGRAEEWLEEHGRGGTVVHGHLVGSRPASDSKAKGAVLLRRRIKRSGPETQWTVRDFLEVLENTEAAHKELLDVHRRATKEAEEEKI